MGERAAKMAGLVIVFVVLLMVTAGLVVAQPLSVGKAPASDPDVHAEVVAPVTAYAWVAHVDRVSARDWVIVTDAARVPPDPEVAERPRFTPPPNGPGPCPPGTLYMRLVFPDGPWWCEPIKYGPPPDPNWPDGMPDW